ncbi:MAG TPA: NAD-dependent epimerase/dehydratase family protein [Bryobacteraceae bacterium]|nr:NAD-dependent epimerase/dehydratase family protein [Bryobacteraceae bacterium]
MATGIIGATGFIGSYLCHHHAGRKPPRIFTRRAANAPSIPGAEIQQGDLLSGPDCERFASALDTIYYLAHTNTPVSSDVDQPTDASLNLVPFLTLLNAIRRLGTRPHVVYFSSGGAVYASRHPRVPFAEHDACAPTTSYGILKIAAEQYLRLAAERGELTATVLRVGNAYGTLLPQYRTQGLIGVALNQLLHGEPVRIFGNSANVRDYVHLQDIASIVWKVSTPRQPFDILNVGSGVGHSVSEVLSIIQNCYGSLFPIQVDENSGRWLPEWVVLDNSRARLEYGWSPTIALRDGVDALLQAARTGLFARPAVTK